MTIFLRKSKAAYPVQPAYAACYEQSGQIMEKLEEVLLETLNENLTQIVISGIKKAAKEEDVQKIKIRPVLIKDELMFQAACYTGKQVFHSNLSKEEAVSFIKEKMNCYKQLQAYGTGIRVSVLSGKKGNLTVKSENVKEAGGAAAENEGAKRREKLSHNREKAYILPKDVPVPFLVDLGVQTKDGKIISDKYDKYRQINRFLEFIRDVLPALPKDGRISIVDFGCGKSYLTFAIYYYLKIMNGLDVEITGLDLKADVIEKCSRLKEKYGYDGLQFLTGDIGSYEGKKQVDMVVTLHACDTATDYALAKAVKWNASVILSVPCCQHELNKQISCEPLQAVFKHGLLKERIAALLTDGIRAQLLEEAGYDVQVMEFIDMEHTPKNILLRCIKNTRMKPKRNQSSEELAAFLNGQLTLQRLLESR